MVPTPVYLGAAVPALRGRLPFCALGTYPTPLERLREVERAAALPPGTELWVKRDDLSGEPWGTSKVRKLEHVFGEALAAGAERVATVGPLGSNHALATAIYARETGLGCLLQLWPEPLTPAICERLRVEVALGAELELLADLGEEALGEPLPAALATQDAPGSVGERAPQTWFVPPAGTDEVGATGYVECGLELAAQLREGAAPRPDHLHVAGGTGGVAAGLAVGLLLAEATAAVTGTAALPVTAVRAVARSVLSIPRMRLLARRVIDRLGRIAGAPLPIATPGPERFRILHDHAGGGYGVATAEGEACARLFLDHGGLTLDPVYTAKAVAGVLAFARGEGRGQRHLFLHTYGDRDLSALAAATPWEAVPAPFRQLLKGASSSDR